MIGEGGQVTIPKEIRESFGFGPETEVKFYVVSGTIVLSKAPKKLNLAKWKVRCAGHSQSWVTPRLTLLSTMCAGGDVD